MIVYRVECDVAGNLERQSVWVDEYACFVNARGQVWSYTNVKAGQHYFDSDGDPACNWIAISRPETADEHHLFADIYRLAGFSALAERTEAIGNLMAEEC